MIQHLLSQISHLSHIVQFVIIALVVLHLGGVAVLLFMHFRSSVKPDKAKLK
mgnify:CR=1 FL=1